MNWVNKTNRQNILYRQAYTSTEISQNVSCIGVWKKDYLLASNLNSVRIVHYQIIDVHK